MIFQLNVAAIVAVAGRTALKHAKPVIVRNAFLLPLVGFLGVILIWWIIDLANRQLMPTPPEALGANLDDILNPFFQRGPDNLGIGWLLLASIRSVLIGFELGAVVAIPVGFVIGMSKTALMVLNPVIQIFKPVSPLAWLPIALAIFNLADPFSNICDFHHLFVAHNHQHCSGSLQCSQRLYRCGTSSANATLANNYKNYLARKFALHFYRFAD